MKHILKNKSLFKLASVTIASGALLGLVGCQSVDGTVNNTMPQTQQITNNLLQSYKWQLVDAKDIKGNKLTPLFTQPNKPLTLNFLNLDGKNILSLENTCNNFSANYVLTNYQVKLGDFVATMKACPDTQAKFDNYAVNTVMGNYSLNKLTDGTPLLTITTNQTQIYFKPVAK